MAKMAALRSIRPGRIFVEDVLAHEPRRPREIRILGKHLRPFNQEIWDDFPMTGNDQFDVR